jgi:hypothetical protein
MLIDIHRWYPNFSTIRSFYGYNNFYFSQIRLVERYSRVFSSMTKRVSLDVNSRSVVSNDNRVRKFSN